MKLELIDMNTWNRGEYLQHYLSNLKNVISMTVDIDITELLSRTKRNDLRFFPAFLYAVTKIVNRHEEFRMGYDPDNNVGIWDEVCPSYIMFHADNETFTRVFTSWKDDFSVFYNDVVSDMDKYRSHSGFSIENVPKNIFDVSTVPWVRYRSFDIHVFDAGVYLPPVITWGKYENVGVGKVIMPLSMQIHHASADGFHVCRFFNEVQDLCDNISI